MVKQSRRASLRSSFGLFLFLGVWGYPGIAYSATSLKECDPEQLESEFRQSKENMAPEQRMAQLEVIFEDILRIEETRKRDPALPQNFIEQCLQKKQRNFQSHTQYAPLHLKASYAYYVLNARLSVHQKKYDQAVEYYRLASERDPKDVASLVRAFEMWQGAELSKLLAQGPQPNREAVLAFTKKNDIYVEAILKNRNTTPTQIVQVLHKKALALKGLGLETEALQAWRSVLQIDSRHVDALYNLAQYELSKKNWAEGRRLLESLANISPQNVPVQKDLLTLLLRDKDYGAALARAKTLVAQIPQDALVQAMLATSYLGLDREAEAITANALAIRLDPKNFLARKNAAELDEFEGDRWAAQKLYGKALAKYMAALQAHPDRQSLRLKAAQVLYDFRREESFRDDPATKADLEQVVKLLAPLVERSMAEEKTLSVYISAAAHSGQLARATKMCDLYQKNYGRLQDEVARSCSMAKKRVPARN